MAKQRSRIFCYGVLLLCFLSCLVTTAQTLTPNTEVRFKPLEVDTESGFSNAGVNDMIEDRQGFLWLATWSGLIRYDGYEIKLYRQQIGEDNGLTSSKVLTLFEDSRGELWIGTRHGGLYRYDRTQDRFEGYAAEADNMNSLSNSSVWTIFEDKEGQLWIGTEKGLNRFDPIKNKFIHYRHDPKDRRSLSHDFIYSIAEGEDGSLWIGTEEGLNRLVRKGKEEYFIRYELAPPGLDSDNYLSHNFIYKIVSSDYVEYCLWVATSSGLKKLRYHPDDLTFYEYETFAEKFPATDGLSHSFVSDVLEMSDTTLWVGTYNGLNYLHTPTGRSKSYFAKANAPHYLSSNYIKSLYCDRRGTIWVGLDQGVNKMHAISSGFQPVFMQLPGTGANARIGAVEPSIEDDGLWVGSAGGGLFFVPLNTQNNQLQTARPLHFYQPRMEQLSRFVSEVLVDRQGWLWVTTEGAGLFRVKASDALASSGEIRRYEQFTKSDKLSDDYIMTALESRAGPLWFGYWDKGLDLYDPITKRFTHFGETSDLSVDLQAFPVVHLLETVEDGQAFLWVGTRGGGVYKLCYSPKQKNLSLVRHYQYEAGVLNSLSSSGVNDFLEDSKGRLWIGTDSGLNLLTNRKQHRLKAYFEQHGLSSGTIQSVEEDGNGDIWISTQYGINRLTFVEDSLVQVRGFSREDGLQDSYFNDDAGTFFNGQLVFGGINGLSVIRPDRIQPDTTKPQTILTGLRLFNEPVDIGQAQHGRIVLPQNISDLEQLSLRHNENTVTIEFVGLHLNLSGTQRYAYRLLGFDSDWIMTDGRERLAHYTRLPHGNYTFQVKSDNGDDLWSEPASIILTIDPPFWLSPWAYLLYLVVAAGLIYMGIRYLRLRTRYRHNLALERMEREKLEEVNRLKVQFFTNISHELRTPLTLIVSPLEQLLQDPPNNYLRQLYTRMSFNANRLLTLIDQLLDIRKHESGLLKLRVVETDMNGFLEEIYAAFQNLAQQRKIDLLYVQSNELVTAWVDPVQLEKVITNLLSNAFKYTKPGGSILIELMESSQGAIIVKVEDTGVGMAEEELPLIFDRFYQVEKTPGWARKSGTGIGLSLAKTIVEKHRGVIQVDSEEGQGTRFTISLKSGKAHFTEEELAPGSSSADFLAEADIQEAVPTAARVGDIPMPLPSAISNTSALAGRPSVLLVEDNEDIRAYLRQNLDQEYHILEAENGLAGQKLAIDEQPSLIVADIAMPKMDGIEMCRQLKADVHTSHIPIILLTARTSLVFKLDSFEQGADAYITKPFNVRLLRTRISNLIKSRKKLQEKYTKNLTLIPENIEGASLDDKLLLRLKEVLEQQLDQSDLSVDMLASELAVSRMQLYRKLKALLHKTPVQVIRHFRLQRAAQLLRTGDYNISEVVYKVGYVDQRSFRKQFKKEFNMSPSEYLHRQQED